MSLITCKVLTSGTLAALRSQKCKLYKLFCRQTNSLVCRQIFKKIRKFLGLATPEAPSLTNSKLPNLLRGAYSHARNAYTFESYVKYVSIIYNRSWLTLLFIARLWIGYSSTIYSGEILR